MQKYNISFVAQTRSGIKFKRVVMEMDPPNERSINDLRNYILHEEKFIDQNIVDIELLAWSPLCK